MNYYLILDVGTTNVKAYAFSEEGEKLLEKSMRTRPVYPEPGWAELDPEELIETVRRLIDEVTSSLGMPRGMGITNQRSSTVVWDDEGALHNMITWQDTRTKNIVEAFSRDFLVRFGRALGKVFYGLSRLVPGIASLPKGAYIITLAHVGFGTSHSSMHLRWLMDNVPEVRRALERGEAKFGTIDSWIAWNLTGKHVTDYTNASATGLFDPFYLKWSDNIMGIVGIPKKILPGLHPNDLPVGETDYGVPLLTMVADQQAALYRAGVEPGSAKMTHGTGTFVDLNVGEKPKPASPGLYPMVALKTRKKTLYLLEGIINASGSAVDWLLKVGLVEDYSEISDAFKDLTLPRVLFIPAFTGLSTPYLRPDFRGALLNLSFSVGRNDVIKALIAGIAMRVAEVIAAMESGTRVEISSLTSDGGASQIDPLLQLIADFSGKKIARPEELNGSAQGTFMITRAVAERRDVLSAWKEPRVERVFEPSGEKHEDFRRLWEEFMGRLL